MIKEIISALPLLVTFWTVCTVDGQVKCEGWIRHNSYSGESKIRLWLNRLIGQTKDGAVWPYPFAEGKLFVLTLRAGLDGYHVDIDGRHISSFPHRAVSKIVDTISPIKLS